MSSTTATPDGGRVRVSFAAIDPFVEVNVVKAVERETRSGGMVYWGEVNRYPEYLWSLYRDVPTLQSVVDGIADYVAGDGAELSALPGAVNRRGDTAYEQVKDAAKDLCIYGGFALQVIRDATGAPAEVYWLDMRYLRTDKERTRFWYSEKWGGYGRANTVVYPAFRPGLDWGSLPPEERAAQASTVLYCAGTRRTTYPVPRWGSAVKACEMERQIDDFHLNSLVNGFYGSLIVNFNNGLPEDDAVKEQVESDFNEKFAGATNAGRVMFSWNDSYAARTTLEAPKVEDFGERYSLLAARARQEIFTAFRANPNLFGIPTDGKGFSEEEYAESFRLFNRTVVKPMQTAIEEVYAKIWGTDGVLTITPLSLGDGSGSGTSVKSENTVKSEGGQGNG